MSDQFITVREAAQTLGISEKKVMDLVEENRLRAYKIAGQFLRLKKSEVLQLQTSGKITQEAVQYPYTSAERISDLLYFNDFYFFCLTIIAVLLYIIFHFK